MAIIDVPEYRRFVKDGSSITTGVLIEETPDISVLLECEILSDVERVFLFKYAMAYNEMNDVVDNYEILNDTFRKIIVIGSDEYCKTIEDMFLIVSEGERRRSTHLNAQIMYCSFLTVFNEKVTDEKLGKFKRMLVAIAGKQSVQHLGEVLDNPNLDIMNAHLDNLILEMKTMRRILVRIYTSDDREIIRENITMFDFSKSYFDETFVLITTTQFVENDLVFLFSSAYVISLLTNGYVLPISNEVLTSREFMVCEDSMASVIIDVVSALRITGKLSYADIFEAPVLIYFNEANKRRIVQCVIKDADLAQLRDVYPLISGSKDESYMLNYFLALSVVEPPRGARRSVLDDFHAYFLESFSTPFRDRKKLVEYYAEFVAGCKVSRHVELLLSERSTEDVFLFYKAFFRRLRKECEGDKDVDLIVLSFFKYIYEHRKVEFLDILPLVSYVPTDAETLYSVYMLYRFMFDVDYAVGASMFPAKTPALVGVAALVTSNGADGRSSLLRIIRIAEAQKLSNYDYSGVIEYVRDPATLSALDQSVRDAIVDVHKANLPSNEGFIADYLEKVFDVLLGDASVCELGKLILVDVIGCLLKKSRIAARSAQNFSMIRKVMEGVRDESVRRALDALFRVTLSSLEDTPYLRNYTVLFVADFLMYHSFFYGGVFEERSFKDASSVVDATRAIYERILAICADDNVSVISADEPTDWLIDAVYIRINDVAVVRRIVAALKCRVFLKPNCNDLYVLLKIGEIICETYDGDTLASFCPVASGDPHFTFRRVVDFYAYITIRNARSVSDRETFAKIAALSSGLYKQHFASLSGGDQRRKACFPLTNYTVDELVLFNNFHNLRDVCEAILAHPLYRMKTDYGSAAQPENTGLLRFNEFYNATFYSNASKAYAFVAWEEECRLVNTSVKNMPWQAAADASAYADMQVTKYVTVPIYFIYRFGRYFAASSSLSLFDLIGVVQTYDMGRDFISFLPEAQLVFLVPQIVQHVYLAKGGEIKNQSKLFGVCLNWYLRACQGHSEENLHTRVTDIITNICNDAGDAVRASRTEKTRRLNELLDLAYDNIEGICKESNERPIFPLNPSIRIDNVVRGSARALQSAEKIPYMVKINTDSGPIKVIVKCGDDCRQDMLVIQVMNLFNEIYQLNNLKLVLFPYKVIATNHNSSMIEVVEAMTRDQIGREKINNLKEYFAVNFRYGPELKTAIEKFTRSFAGYSLLIYILDIKDRHNGNIMIGPDGSCIHIDFGFILDISPGNLNVEIPLKLTKECVELIDMDHYKELMVDGFMALRSRSKDIVLLVQSMKDSGLPCFRKSTIDNLYKRFRMDLSFQEAKDYILKMIDSSVMSKRTWIYEKYQSMTNDIRF